MAEYVRQYDTVDDLVFNPDFYDIRWSAVPERQTIRRVSARVTRILINRLRYRSGSSAGLTLTHNDKDWLQGCADAGPEHERFVYQALLALLEEHQAVSLFCRAHIKEDTS